MPQRKVVFVNRYFYPDISATSQHLSDLAFHLAREGVPVHVVTSRQAYSDAQARLGADEVVGGVHVSRIWSSRFGRHRLLGRALDYVTFYVAALWALFRLAQRGDVVVAKTDPPLVSVVAMTVAKLRGAVLVNWLHDLFPEIASVLGVRGMTGRLARLLERLRDRSLASAACNVVIGEAMETRLKARLREGGDRVRVIHNWADGEAIKPSPVDANPLRKLWGLERRFVAGYSGNMGRGHEFETMLRAAQALCDDARFVFLFIGDGARRREIEQRVAEWGLGNVMFQPYQPREALAQSLTVPDVHLVSMRPELEELMLPSKIYGIAAAGRPAIFIGHPEGEVARLLKEERCGYSTAQGDWATLVKQLQGLANDASLCEGMGRNARAVFERRFDKPIAMKAWRELLLSL
jgi:glycosyltransferase involved in cell wall biosynthesis